MSAAASAPRQKSLLYVSGDQKAGNSAAKSSLTEEIASGQPTVELVQFAADKQNEVNDDQLQKFSTKDGTVWYRSKKLSVSWLLLSENCLEVKTELKEKNTTAVDNMLCM